MNENRLFCFLDVSSTHRFRHWGSRNSSQQPINPLSRLDFVHTPERHTIILGDAPAFEAVRYGLLSPRHAFTQVRASTPPSALRSAVTHDRSSVSSTVDLGNRHAMNGHGEVHDLIRISERFTS